MVKHGTPRTTSQREKSRYTGIKPRKIAKIQKIGNNLWRF